MNIYYTQAIKTLSALDVLSHLILQIIPRKDHCYYPHFITEKDEVWKASITIADDMLKIIYRAKLLDPKLWVLT